MWKNRELKEISDELSEGLLDISKTGAVSWQVRSRFQPASVAGVFPTA
jgi:hypothetical protein